MRKTGIFLTTLLTVFMLNGQVQAAINDGLVAHYPFDGNAIDASENGNDGTEYGGVTYADGVLDQAVNFDGTENYIVLPILSPDNITLSVWIKGNNQGGIYSDGGPTIIEGWTGGEFLGLSYDYFSKDDLYLVGFDGPGYYLNGSFHPRYNSTEIFDSRSLIHKINLNDSKWYFVALSYDDNTKVASLFVDGIKEVEFNFSNVLHYQSSGSYPTSYSLGLWKRVDDFSFTGVIDDVYIYNRALTEPEIKELYNEGGSVSACTQDDFGGQCVAYVRNQFGGSYDSMPGLCKYSADCGAYHAWGNWDLGFGSSRTPDVDSIMVHNRQMFMPFGHVAIVKSVQLNIDGTYALLVDESNWDLDELVDCGVKYTYDPLTSIAIRNDGHSPITVLGFIYNLPAQAKDTEDDG